MEWSENTHYYLYLNLFRPNFLGLDPSLESLSRNFVTKMVLLFTIWLKFKSSSAKACPNLNSSISYQQCHLFIPLFLWVAKCILYIHLSCCSCLTSITTLQNNLNWQQTNTAATDTFLSNSVVFTLFCLFWAKVWFCVPALRVTVDLCNAGMSQPDWACAWDIPHD